MRPMARCSSGRLHIEPVRFSSYDPQNTCITRYWCTVCPAAPCCHECSEGQCAGAASWQSSKWQRANAWAFPLLALVIAVLIVFVVGPILQLLMVSHALCCSA